jgi:predicted RNA-binding protein with PUA-like domain
MRYWILKSEPAAYGWDDLVRDGATEWTGVRNHAAAANLRAMAVGDEALFYHSLTGLEAVGIARVSRIAAPDPTNDAWVSVEIQPVRPLATPVTLKAMKADARLAELAMVRQSRLSVSPVRDAEWAAILELAA